MTAQTATVTVTIEDAGPDLDFGLAGDNSTLTRTFLVTVTPEDALDVSELPAAGGQVTIDLSRSANQLLVELDGATLGTLEIGNLPSLTITGNDDDNRLVVDFSGGNPIPAGGLTFLGGSQSTMTGRLDRTDRRFRDGPCSRLYEWQFRQHRHRWLDDFLQ